MCFQTWKTSCQGNDGGGIKQKPPSSVIWVSCCAVCKSWILGFVILRTSRIPKVLRVHLFLKASWKSLTNVFMSDQSHRDRLMDVGQHPTGSCWNKTFCLDETEFYLHLMICLPKFITVLCHLETVLPFCCF